MPEHLEKFICLCSLHLNFAALIHSPQVQTASSDQKTWNYDLMLPGYGWLRSIDVVNKIISPCQRFMLLGALMSGCMY